MSLLPVINRKYTVESVSVTRYLATMAKLLLCKMDVTFVAAAGGVMHIKV